MIILDTNQLERAQPPDGPLIAMLQTLGTQTGHHLLLPELVLEEHLAHYRRGVETATARRQEAESDLIRLIPNICYQEQPPPNVDNAVRDRTARLKQVFQIVPTPDTAAHEALLREARRMPPAKTSHDGPGSGARDAAIWLTAVDACRASAEATYFVAADNNAFGKGDLKPQLIEELKQQLGTGVGLFHYCSGLDVLLDGLATLHREAPSLTVIAADIRVRAAVASSLHGREVSSQLLHSAGLLQYGVVSHLPGQSLERLERPNDAVIAYRVGDSTWACARPSWRAIRRYLVDPGNWSDRYAVELSFGITTTVMVQMDREGNITSAQVTARSGVSRIQGTPIDRDIAMWGIKLDLHDDEDAQTIESTDF